jgi:hypothetical protein
MAEKRKAYAPFSLITESGVANSPVEGYIDVDQMVQPTVSTGTVNENGTWVGVKSSDSEFFGFTKHVAIPNGESVLAPQGQIDFIDMTGFKDLFLALRISNAGNFALEAVMGPDTNRFANLTPIVAAATLKWTWPNDDTGTVTVFQPCLSDSSEGLTADAWNILSVVGRLTNQKNMQLKVTNNSGGDSDIEVAFMRLV